VVVPPGLVVRIVVALSGWGSAAAGAVVSVPPG